MAAATEGMKKGNNINGKPFRRADANYFSQIRKFSGGSR